MAETDILLSGTIDFILQCAIYCLPDVIIKYVRCKKNPMAAWDFFIGEKSSARQWARILLRKTSIAVHK